MFDPASRDHLVQALTESAELARQLAGRAESSLGGLSFIAARLRVISYELERNTDTVRGPFP